MNAPKSVLRTSPPEPKPRGAKATAGGTWEEAGPGDGGPSRTSESGSLGGPPTFLPNLWD